MEGEAKKRWETVEYVKTLFRCQNDVVTAMDFIGLRDMSRENGLFAPAVMTRHGLELVEPKLRGKTPL